ncbi:hypothetical protein [Bacillus sp. NEB1478]|uniref:hypothetical protein n=1 Tax=Bacillus sp. NEB1478 TaxID=3073816 RepID=UPI00287363C5|nr:hypothetical protein [Bacillus sp. NEB1478]WNB90874.1 hypothetical protein RGB74_13245 [Bacillus sp. NEB1478]
MKYFGPAWLVFLGGIILLFSVGGLFGEINGEVILTVLILYLCAVITGCTFMIVDAIKGINEPKEQKEKKEQKSIKHLDY